MKINTIFLTLISILVFSSCGKGGNEEPELFVDKDYIFEFKLKENLFEYGDLSSEYGSTTKNESINAYSDFYNKFLSTKKLTPRQYSLYLFDITDGENIFGLDGFWGVKNNVVCLSSEYYIKMESYPSEGYNATGSDSIYIQGTATEKILNKKDKVVFNDIKPHCAMLLFNGNKYKSVIAACGFTRKNLIKHGDYYIMFLMPEYFNVNIRIQLEYVQPNDKNYELIDIRNLNLKEGHYYYVNF